MDLGTYLKQPGRSQQGLADKLGVSQGLISQYLSWLEGGRGANATRPPAERCEDIEKATDGEVTRHDLRPDLFGPPQVKASKRSRAANSPQTKAAA